MPRDDAIARLHRKVSRRTDDGTRDIALGLLLFSMGVALDLGRAPVMMAIFIPLIVAALKFHLVWPRAGYARETREFVAETAQLFGLSCLVLLALGAAIDTGGTTGTASTAGEALTRRVTLAAILALPGLLAWIAHRRGLVRYFAYAIGIVAAFAVGPIAGLEARAWALALFSLATVAIGLLRLRQFLALHPPAPEGDLAA
jgi:hypothetical protein